MAACVDVACSSSTNTTLDSSGNVGLYTSIAIGVDGKPIISYLKATGGDLKLARCVDTTCTSSTNTAIDTSGVVVGEFTSIAIGPEGRPVVSYVDVVPGGLKLLVCADPTCASSSKSTLDTGGGLVPQVSSIAIGVDGSPIISYYDNNGRNLLVADLSHTAWAPNGWGR